MRTEPRPEEMYRHFKGNIYQIRCLAKHSETGEMMVVYQAMYDTFQIYVRPLDMFMEEVDHVKYPDVKQKYRFELLQDLQDMGITPQGQARAQGTPIQKEAEEQETVVQSQTHGPEMTFRPQPHEQGESGIHPQTYEPTTESDEQLHIDPLVMEFLDADTYEQRLNILAALRYKITDEMINTMAVAVDLEIKDGDIEERYEELKNCLLTFEKYECNRLR
ncbi:MAG: DUF1653 domain-containing protein [Eubacterium sp.]|nr:DUF1653 domain-containing protein [Eubacterium sp.]